MRLMKSMVAMLLALAAMVGRAGESAEFRLDTMDGTRVARAVETIAYSTAWNTGGITANIFIDGILVKSTGIMEVGDFIWNAAQAGPGTHTLTHTCGGETLTAVFEVPKDVVVHFNANGGEFKNGSGNKVKEYDQYFTYDAPQKLFTDDLVPQKPGNEFLGWVRGSPEVDSSDSIIEGRAEMTWHEDVTEVTLYAVWTSTITVSFCNSGDDLIPASLADHVFWSVDGNLAGSSVRLRGGESAQAGPGSRKISFSVDPAYRRFTWNFAPKGVYSQLYNPASGIMTVDIGNNYQDSLLYSSPQESRHPIAVEVGPPKDQTCRVWFKCAGETVQGQTFRSSDVNITVTYYGSDGSSAATVVSGFSGDSTRYPLPWGTYMVEGRSRDGKWLSPISKLVLNDTIQTVYLNFHYTGDGALSGRELTLNAGYGTVDPNVIGVLAHTEAARPWMEVPQLPTPEFAGHEFLGWWTKENGKGRRVEAGTRFYGSEVGDRTLYAHWKTGVFERMLLAAFGGSVKTTFVSGTTSVTLTGNISGTVEIPDNVGAVTIDLNGYSIVGDGGALGEDAQPGGPAIRIVRGDGAGTVTQLVLADTSDGATGQIVGGSQSSGIEVTGDAASGVSLGFEERVPVFNGDGSDQAMNVCTVTFNASGGAVSPATRTVAGGFAVGALPTPARTGYRFLGWFTAANGGTEVTATTKVTGKVTCYAHWQPVYTLVFHRNDASDEKTAAYEFDYGVSTRIPSLAKLGWARRGCDFLGWATSRANADAGKVWKKDWATVSAAVAAGKTLDVYAVWALKPGSYAIEFIRNDGAGTWRTVGFTYGEKTRLPSVANGLGWARRGYAFKGWALTTADANAGKVWKGDWAYVSTPVKAGQVLTAYAVWALKPGYYQIRFNKNDGSGRWRTLGFEYGAKTRLPTCGNGLGWTREGYEFAGWSLGAVNAAAGGVKWMKWKDDWAYVSTPTTAGRTISIYAIWE